MEDEQIGLLRFLRTERSKDDLKLCLDVLREFRCCESRDEWAFGSFESWARLEQFENYLQLLTGTEVEDVDDKVAKDFFNTITPSPD